MCDQIEFKVAIIAKAKKNRCVSGYPPIPRKTYPTYNFFASKESCDVRGREGQCWGTRVFLELATGYILG